MELPTPGHDNQDFENPQPTYLISDHYSNHEFHGIMIDTGAAKWSTAGYEQLKALQRICDVPIDRTTAGKVKIIFGIGETSNVGSVNIPTPIGTIEFQVVESRTPFLLSI